jgi:hypothetical protein
MVLELFVLGHVEHDERLRFIFDGLRVVQQGLAETMLVRHCTASDPQSLTGIMAAIILKIQSLGSLGEHDLFIPTE